MSNYIKNLSVYIDEKIITYAIENGVSLIDMDILYYNFIDEISNIYRNPNKHYSKIMVMAFKKTMKEYENWK